MSKPLLQKNTRSVLVWLPVVLLLGSLLFYVMLQMHAHHMQEKQLLLKQNNVWKAFISQPENFVRHVRGEYDIKEATAPNTNIEPRDTVISYKEENQSLPFEALTTSNAWNLKNYEVTTYVSSKELHHLIIKAFITEAVILILLLLTIVIVNKRNSISLWKPFFSTIQKV